MAIKILFKRGTAAQNDAFTGESGVITIDTENNRLRIHDGVTPGGHSAASLQDVQNIVNTVDNLAIADIAGLEAALTQIGADITAVEDRATALEGRATALETETARLETDKIDVAEKGVADGVATLDSNGKVPLTQLSDSILGQVEYMGVWDAATNTPALPLDASGLKGNYYVTTVAGTFDGKSFEVGDWIISNGTTWDKVDNTDAVATVQGRTGNVVITAADLGLENVDNTSDADKPISTATQAALDLKADITYVDSQISALNTGVSSVTGTGAILVDNTDPANPVISISEATTVAAGAMSAADKAKLDGIEAGAQVNTVDSVNGYTGVVVLTKADVGLGNVDNFATATQVEAEGGTAADKFMTPERTKQFVENGTYTLDMGTF
jgi:hypothetical protein